MEDNVVKDVRNFFRPKKEIANEIEENMAKNVRNIFRPTKENKVIQERIIRDITNLSE